MAKTIKKTDLIDSGVLDDFKKEVKETKTETDLLVGSLNALNSAQEAIQQTAKETKQGILGVDRKKVEDLNKLNKLKKEAHQLAVNDEKIKKQRLQTEQQIEKNRQLEIKGQVALRKETERLAKTNAKNIKATKDQGNAYKQLVIKTREEKNESKRLSVELLNLSASGKKNTKEFKKLSAQYRATTRNAQNMDKQLKKIDSTVGDNFRNVGNYKNALSGLRSGLAQFGATMGAFQLLRGAGETVANFEQNVADLSAITGAVDGELNKFKDSAKTLGVEVEGGASAVVEAFKLIGSAKPELLENSSALIKVTESAILLSKASGIALPEASSKLTDAMNQFGASAEDADKFVNVLANGAKFGSAEIPQITEALLKFGASARTSNVSIQESTALIEILAKNGKKGAEAGTALRNVMAKLSAPDVLPKKAQDALNRLGISFEDLKDPSKTFSERLEGLNPLLEDSGALIEVFGLENQIGAQILIENAEAVGNLTGKMDTLNTSNEQAKTRSETLSFATNKLKETWNSWILSVNDGIGGASKLTKFLDFLSNNLETVATLVLKFATAFVVFKASLLAMKLGSRIKEYREFNKALKEGSVVSGQASKGIKGFGKALKGLAIAGGIMILLEIASALWNIASGARMARIETELLNKAIAEGDAEAQKRLGEIAENEEKRLRALDLRRAKERMSDKEYLKNKELILNDTKKLLDLEVQAQKDAFQDMKGELEVAEAKLFREKERIFQGSSGSAVKKAFAETAWNAYTSFGEGKVLFDNRNRLIAQEETLRVKIRAYKGALKEANVVIEEHTIETVGSTNATNDATDAQDELNDSLNKAIEIQKRINELENIEVKAQIEDEEDTFQDELKNQERNAELLGKFETDKLNEQIDKIFNLKERQLIDERDFRKRIAEQTIDDADLLKLEIEKIELEHKLKMEDLDKEELKLREQTIDSLISKQGEYDEALKTTDENKDDLLEKERKRAEERNKIIDAVTKYFIKQSNERLKAIDKEIQAHQKQADFLRGLAESGNITAKESLAEENRLIAEANAKKEREEKRKQRIELASTVLKSYNLKLADGKSGTEALLETFTEVGSLTAFINALPTFLDGVENTGKNGAGIDGKGGFLSVLHPEEAVLKKELNQKKMNAGLTNETMIEKAINYDSIAETQNISSKIDAGIQIHQGFDSHLIVNELLSLKDEMKSVKNSIDEKPVPDMQIGQITQKSMEIMQSLKKGNKRTTNIFKVNYE